MTAHPLGRIFPASTWMQAELRRPVLGSFRLNPRKDQNRRLWMPRMQARAWCDQRGLELPRFVFRLRRAASSAVRAWRNGVEIVAPRSTVATVLYLEDAYWRIVRSVPSMSTRWSTRCSVLVVCIRAEQECCVLTTKVLSPRPHHGTTAFQPAAHPNMLVLVHPQSLTVSRPPLAIP